MKYALSTTDTNKSAYDTSPVDDGFKFIYFTICVLYDIFYDLD